LEREQRAKVLVPILRRDSGNHVHCGDLKTIVRPIGNELRLVSLPSDLDFTPAIAKAKPRWRLEVEESALVHTNGDYGTGFRVPGKPPIVAVHHNVFNECYRRYTTIAQIAYHHGLLKQRLTKALKDADRVVAVSESTRASLERTFGAAKIDVIYNGIDADLLQPKPLPVPPGRRRSR
jgi:glycosyltransferase involved in cell wall biosynthesis